MLMALEPMTGVCTTKNFPHCYTDVLNVNAAVFIKMAIYVSASDIKKVLKNYLYVSTLLFVEYT